MKIAQTSAITFISKFGSSVIGFIATVYFARELGADVLGTYFLTLATVAWLKLGSNFGVPFAVIKRVSEGKDKNQYITAGLLLTLAGFSLVATLIFVFRAQINQYLGSSLYVFLILLLGAEVAYKFVGAVLKGNHLVHVNGVLGIFQTLIRVSMQVLAVFMGYQVTGLLFGEVTSFFIVSAIGLVLLGIRYNRPVKLKKVSRSHFYSIIHFAKFSVLRSLKGKSFNMMDTIVLGFFVPSGLIGIYGICWNISSVLSIFADSLSTSLFPEMSKLSSANKEQQVANHLSDALAFAGLFIIPGFIGALVVGEGLLNIYGEEFQRGYTVLVILVAAILFHSYHKQLVNTMDAIDRPELSFRVNMFFVTTNILMNVVLVYIYGWTGAAVATLVSVFISMLLAYTLMNRLLDFKIPYMEISRQILSAVVMGLLVYSFIILLSSVGINVHRSVPVLIAITFGVGVYFGCLVVVSRRFRETVLDNLPINVSL